MVRVLSITDAAGETAAEWLRRHRVDASTVIDRLITSLNLHTDAELARYIGVKKTTLSSWRTRDRIPYDEIHKLHLLGEVDLSYCLTGIPFKVSDRAQAERILASTLHDLRTAYDRLPAARSKLLKAGEKSRSSKNKDSDSEGSQ